MSSVDVVPALVLSIFVGACSPKGASTSGARSQDEAQPSTEVAPQTSADEAEASEASTRSAVPGDGPMFEYQQDGHTVRFSAPNEVLFLRGSKAWRSCSGKLGDDGNMWTGSDVENAFADPEVVSALEHESRYQVEGARAKLTATGRSGSITWLSSCDDCPTEPPGVKHFREIMQTVTANRAAVCD